MSEQQSLIPLSSGEALRHQREARKLTLAAVARRLKCNTEIITAIEADQPIDMPPVYLRGFLKAYSDLLGLDQESREQLLARHEPITPQVQSIFPEHMAQVTTDRWLKVASYLLASLLVGTLAWQLTHEALRLANVEGTAAAGQVAEPGERRVRPAGNPVNASIATLENVRQSAGSRTGDAGAKAWEALDRAAARTPLADGNYQLQVTASADTWVDIVAGDGTQLEQDLMRGGDQRNYLGAGPFQLSFGRASAIELTLNGRAIDLRPYTREDVTQMLLQPADVVFLETASSTAANNTEPDSAETP